MRILTVEDLPGTRAKSRRQGRQKLPLPLQKIQSVLYQVINNSLRKIKAQKLRWTTAWRRLNRKTQKDDAGKKKKKRVFKRERAIEGVTLDAIKKMKTAKPEERKALAQEAILEIKERKKGLIEKKRAEKKVNTKAPAAQKPVKVADKGGKKPAVKGKK